jgi:hypothetical protein
MKINLELIFLAILGSVLAYYIIDTVIIQISFIKFFLVELTITLMHALYSYRRRCIIKKV